MEHKERNTDTGPSNNQMEAMQRALAAHEMIRELEENHRRDMELLIHERAYSIHSALELKVPVETLSRIFGGVSTRRIYAMRLQSDRYEPRPRKRRRK